MRLKSFMVPFNLKLTEYAAYGWMSKDGNIKEENVAGLCDLGMQLGIKVPSPRDAIHFQKATC